MNDLPKKPARDVVAEPEAEERDDAIIGRALAWSLGAIFCVALIVGGAILWLRRPAPAPVEKQTELQQVKVRELPPLEVPAVRFTDVTHEAGVRFVPENGASGEKLLPETMAGGGGFFDYDADGDADLLLINGMRWPSDPRGPGEPSRLLLLQNDGRGKFADTTAGSGLDVSLYGMGVAFGDYDNDGRVDVFVSAVGPNRLFHNLGDGKFQDVTEAAGVAGESDQWSTSCGFFDYDRDGDLDLFVAKYVKWSRDFDLAQNFQLTGGGRAYGRPQAFQGTFPNLYRNDGDGRFRDVSAESGVQVRNSDTQVATGKSLGVTFTDVDDDGWLDVVVANDTVQNFLFRNLQNGAFEEVGTTAGIAFDTNGAARGAMGIDAAYFRNNDAIGIGIGNFANEMTALYVSNREEMQFVDEAVATGMGPRTRLELTFGVFFFDYDLDGRLDLFATNGHLEDDINRVQPSQHYEQAPHLFWNCGPEERTEFMQVPADRCGTDVYQPTVGRGAAYADVDADGDLDVLIVACGKPARLLRNDQNLGHHWLRFRLTGTRSNRDAIGAVVKIETSRGTLRRQVMPTRSYQSQVELPVTFGLGADPQIQSIHIRWPDGTEQEVTEWKLDELNSIQQPAAP